MVYEIKKVKHIFEVVGNVVGYIMGDYYDRLGYVLCKQCKEC